MLTDASALPRLLPHIQLGFREQDALKWVFELPENKKHRIYEPRHWFNVYDTYYEQMGEVVMNGSLVVHFPGMGNARPDGMGKWLDILDHTPEELQIPLENTSYPAEIESYWSRLKGAALVLQRSEDWLNTIKENEEMDTSVDKHIPVKITDARRELQEIIQEEPYEKDKLREAVLKLDSAVRSGMKITDLIQLKQDEARKADAERERQGVEEQARKEEEEQMKKEDAERKAAEEKGESKGEEKSKANGDDDGDNEDTGKDTESNTPNDQARKGSTSDLRIKVAENQSDEAEEQADEQANDGEKEEEEEKAERQ